MTACPLPPAPVGQQGPPRATLRLPGFLRVARGSLLLTTGTGSTVLDVRTNTEIRNASNGSRTHATLIGIDRNDDRIRWHS